MWVAWGEWMTSTGSRPGVGHAVEQALTGAEHHGYHVEHQLVDRARGERLAHGRRATGDVDVPAAGGVPGPREGGGEAAGDEAALVRSGDEAVDGDGHVTRGSSRESRDDHGGPNSSAGGVSGCARGSRKSACRPSSPPRTARR